MKNSIFFLMFLSVSNNAFADTGKCTLNTLRWISDDSATVLSNQTIEEITLQKCVAYFEQLIIKAKNTGSTSSLQIRTNFDGGSYVSMVRNF